jgi:hypothetical protein
VRTILIVGYDLEVETDGALPLCSRVIGMAAQTLQGVKTSGQSLTLVRFLDVLLEFPGRMEGIRTTEVTLPGPPVISLHVIDPIAAAQVLMLWHCA